MKNSNGLYPELSGLIREKFKTQEAFADAIDRSPCTVSKKLQGHTEWTAKDIRETCAVLGIPPEKIPVYFF